MSKETIEVVPAPINTIKVGDRLWVRGVGGIGRAMKTVERVIINEVNGAVTVRFDDGGSEVRAPHYMVHKAITVPPPPARVVPRAVQTVQPAPPAPPESVTAKSEKRGPNRGCASGKCAR